MGFIIISENKKKATTSKDKHESPKYTKEEKEFADGKGSQLSNQLNHKTPKGKEKNKVSVKLKTQFCTDSLNRFALKAA